MAKKYGAKKPNRGKQVVLKPKHPVLGSNDSAVDTYQACARAFAKGDAAATEQMLCFARAGNADAQKEYFNRVMTGALQDVDWNELEQWANALLLVEPPLAHAMLGCLYAPGLPGYSDFSVAETHFCQGVDGGSALCRQYLGQLYWREKRSEHSLHELQEMMLSAEVDKAPLCHDLADICAALDDAEGELLYLKKWYQLEPKNAECCRRLGRAYAEGCGCRVNADLAYKYYQAAAYLGDVESVFQMGLMHYNGLGVRCNLARAVELFRRAAESGLGSACYYLACCYTLGEGVEQDNNQAVYWLEEGVRLSDVDCCLASAEDYVDSILRKKDFDKAEHYLSLAQLYAPPQRHDDIMAHIDRIRSLMKQGIAEAKLEEWVEAEVAKARQMFELGDYDAFASICIKILQFAPTHPRALKLSKMVLALRSFISKELLLEIRGLLRKNAEEDSELAVLVGDMYYWGDGMVLNTQSAHRFYLRAWEQSESLESGLRLFLGYHEKVFHSADYSAAGWVECLRTLYPRHPKITLLCGILHRLGLYVLHDLSVSRFFLRDAYSQGISVLTDADFAAIQSDKKALRSIILPETQSADALAPKLKQKKFNFKFD